MLEKSESLNKPLLIIGCGHKSIDCSKAHPPETAITLDRDPQIEPNYTIDFLSNSLPEGLQTDNFKAIILEYFPYYAHKKALKLSQNVLNNGGIIVILGFHLYDIAFLKELKGFYYPSGEDHILLTKQHNSLELYKLIHNVPQLNNYLLSCDIDTSMEPTPVNLIENEAYCFTPDAIFENESLWAGIRLLINFNGDEPLNQVNTICAINKAIYENSVSPLTRRNLTTYTTSYKPGFFQNSLNDCAKGMSDLLSFIAKGNIHDTTPLTKSERNELCDIIVQSQDALPEDYSEEATKIFMAILEHLLKSEEALKAEIKANLEPYFIRL